MVLSIVADIGIEIGWFIIKNAVRATYHLGSYIIYGKQETNDEKLQRQINELRAENEQLKLIIPKYSNKLLQ